MFSVLKVASSGVSVRQFPSNNEMQQYIASLGEMSMDTVPADGWRAPS